MENRRINRDNGHGIREELIRQGSEHVPYMQVVLCQGIEDVRRAIVNSEDGGLSALDGLYCILPSEVRVMFSDLPHEILYEGRVRSYYTIHRKRHGKITVGGNDVKLEYSPSSGKIEEIRSKPRTYDGYKQVKTLHVEYVTPKQSKRQFVMEWFTKILDVLESKGLLQQTKVELVGNED